MRSSRVVAVAALLLAAACTSSKGSAHPAAASPTLGVGDQFQAWLNVVGTESDTFFAKIGPTTTNVEALNDAVPLVKALQKFDDQIQTLKVTPDQHKAIQAVLNADGALENDLSAVSSAAGTFKADSDKAKVAYDAARVALGIQND